MTIQTNYLKLIKGTEEDTWDHELLLNANWDKIEKKLTGLFVNVKEFGAIGNGIVDDSQAINSAIAYCSLNGGILYFPKGSYAGIYTIPDNITVLKESGEFHQSLDSFFRFGTKLPNPAKPGMTYYDSANKTLKIYDGTVWVDFLKLTGGTISGSLAITGSLGITGPLTGSSGTFTGTIKSPEGNFSGPVKTDNLQAVIGSTTGNFGVGGNLTIEGNLNVKGSTVTLDSVTVLIKDNILTLNNGVTGTPILDAGIEVNRGSSPMSKLLWQESSDQWKVDEGDGTLLPIDIRKTVTALPTAVVALRGQIYRLNPTNTSIKDSLYICTRTSTGTYVWSELSFAADVQALTGILTDLATNGKTNLVVAINSLVTETDMLEQESVETNSRVDDLQGYVEELELSTSGGFVLSNNKSTLLTTTTEGLRTDIGVLTGLNTIVKTSLTAAINEVNLKSAAANPNLAGAATLAEAVTKINNILAALRTAGLMKP